MPTTTFYNHQIYDTDMGDFLGPSSLISYGLLRRWIYRLDLTSLLTCLHEQVRSSKLASLAVTSSPSFP
jgi:hypothetical protein